MHWSLWPGGGEEAPLGFPGEKKVFAHWVASIYTILFLSGIFRNSPLFYQRGRFPFSGGVCAPWMGLAGRVVSLPIVFTALMIAIAKARKFLCRALYRTSQGLAVGMKMMGMGMATALLHISSAPACMSG